MAAHPWHDIADVPLHRTRELKRFFEGYKALENKKVVVREPQGRKAALEAPREPIRLYDRERDRLAGAPSAKVPRRRARSRGSSA